MHPTDKTQKQAHSLLVQRSLTLAVAALLSGIPAVAQSATSASNRPVKTPSHRSAKKPPAAVTVAQAPAPPPMPRWPVNDKPNPASVVWDASGLRINASNSSLQQILNEVSTDTGTKILGSVPDQRVFGTYGPGEASDVLLQLLQGSGFNVLLAGDLGRGAPSQIVLSPRRSGSPNAAQGVNPQQQPEAQQDQEDQETGDQQEPPDQPEETVPAIPPPNQQPNQGQPGPNGPMRTPQEIMQEMQQRQLLQQQQMQQQMQQQQQQGNPTAPQQENPE